MAKAMRRRNFITFVSGAAAWSVVARAQQPAVPVIGFLNSASADGLASAVAAFRDGLHETGYVDGRNVTIDYRWADNRNDGVPALAADLVRRGVTVITATSNVTTFAAKAATANIPIVFSVSVDPVAVGLVASLAQPGGNLTGVTTLNTELLMKRLQMLHDLVPSATTMALLVNPTNPSAETDTRKAQDAARVLGLQLHLLHAGSEREFEAAFSSMAQLRAGALMIVPDNFFNSQTKQLAGLANRHAIPAAYQYPDFTASGGLMSYGGNLTDAYRRVGVYAGRIIAGAKPAELPVEQLTKLELIINLRTAKALGLTIRQDVLSVADEVIE